MKGISRCLIGECCTYRGDGNPNEQIIALYEREGGVLICPEVLGGLPVPRDMAEIVSENPLKVMTAHGIDVTDAFVKGAEIAAEMLVQHQVDTVILKSNSPSCGVGSIYDGTFSHTVVKKDGLLTRLLRNHDMMLVTEKDFEDGELNHREE